MDDSKRGAGAPRRTPDPNLRRRFRPGRRPGVAVLAAVAVVLASALAFGSVAGGGGTGNTAPKRGGTLKLLGQSDIFNLDTTSGYYTVNNILYRATTRQLLEVARLVLVRASAHAGS